MNARAASGSSCRPASVVDHLQGFGVRCRGPVRARGRDRVERVGDADDPRLDRDPLPREPVRIAAAVPALVMPAHRRGERRVAEALDHLAARGGVLLHELELRVGEPTRLVDDLRRDAQLADVVDRRGGLGAFHLLVRQVHALRDHRHVARDAARVTVQVRVLGVQRGAQLAQQLRLAGAVGVAGLTEQLVGALEPPFGASPAQPAPQQQVAEEHVAAGVTAPVRAARAGEREREHDGEQHPDPQGREHAERAQDADDHRGQDHHEDGRNDHLRPGGARTHPPILHQMRSPGYPAQWRGSDPG